MMSMFRKFSQLLRTRVCGILFTICLISPVLVVSASANFNVEFRSADGSEVYGSYWDCKNFLPEQSDDPLYLVTFILHEGLLESTFDVVSYDSAILGWSLNPNRGVADFPRGEYATLPSSSELIPVYLVLEGNSPSEPDPEPVPEPDFYPLARPANWNSGGNYAVSGYCDNTLYGDPDIKTNTQLFPISYPTTTQVVELGTNYNTFRPQITLQFAEDFRNVYYNILVRQAWFVDGEIPSTVQLNDVGLDGTITFENLLTNPSPVSMYSIYSFDNSIDCSTTIDRVNGIIYFDYRISVYVPDSVEEAMHQGTRVRFDLKHKNTLSGLSIDTERSFVNLVSAYGEVSETDMLAQVKYEAYRDKSNQQMQEGEAVIKDLESLVKPDPEQIVPDYLPSPHEFDDISSVLSPFFEIPLLMSICSMVLGFAFVSYVLFGKRG